MRKSYHEDIIDEFLSELDKGNTAPALKDGLGVIRDLSVCWMWNAYNTINNEKLIKKVNFYSIK